MDSLVPDGAGSIPARTVVDFDTSFLVAHSVVEWWKKSTLKTQCSALVETDEMCRTLENFPTGSPVLQLLLYPTLCVSKVTFLENIYLKILKFSTK